MIQKIKKNLIDFFKSPKEVISFFAPILLALILIIPTNYTVTVGGGIINMDKKIEVKMKLLRKVVLIHVMFVNLMEQFYLIF